MTRALQIGSSIIAALLQAGLPMGPLTLLPVHGRKSGKVHTIPVTPNVT
jgi:hypothetical protein